MAFVILLAGCTSSKKPIEQLDSIFPAEVESVTVIQQSSGTENKFIVEGSDLEALKEWAASLTPWEKVSFQEGQYPGQQEEGGNLYFFDLGNEYSSLSYRDFGNCYFVVEEDWYLIRNPIDPPIPMVSPAIDKMILVDGKLYYDTGKESSLTARCGVMDGEITSTVEENETPTADNQSNFGVGYGYQYGEKDTIEVCINDTWIVFAYRGSDGSTDISSDTSVDS